jgi:hypothetical protein
MLLIKETNQVKMRSMLNLKINSKRLGDLLACPISNKNHSKLFPI